MKSVFDCINETNGEYGPIYQKNDRGFSHYDDRNHIVVYRLTNGPKEVIDKWDSVGVSPSSEEEEFDYVNVELKYDDNQLAVTLPDMFDSYSAKIGWYGFKVKGELRDYHETGLKRSDLKPVKGRGSMNDKYPEESAKAADFLVWFFEKMGVPLFRY